MQLTYMYHYVYQMITKKNQIQGLIFLHILQQQVFLHIAQMLLQPGVFFFPFLKQGLIQFNRLVRKQNNTCFNKL